MSRRPIRTLALAITVAAALTACAGLPVTGPVNVGRAIDEVERLPDFAYVPDGPVADATPQQIVEGFIAAGSGPRQNWATAQQFLTADFREDWKPQAGVTIHAPGDRTIDVVSDQKIQVSIDPVATVDAAGAYRPGGDGPISLRYELVQEEGQWRIALAPDGIVLDANRFSTVFRSYELAYFDPTWSSLVPDVRWFPTTNSATRIAAAVVAGTPSPWLASSVRTAFPGDVTLTQPSVPVDAGVAQVSLDPSARELAPETLARMQTQLEASLAAAGVVDVQMLVGDEAIDAPPVQVTEHRVDVRPLVLKDDRFGFLSGAEVDETVALGDAWQGVAATAIEVDAERTTAALQDEAGAIYRADAEGNLVTLDTRPGMTAPTVDAFGHVWTVPSASPTEVVAYGPDGSATTVPGGWLGATDVSAMRISRDGTRMVALVRDGVTPAVWVSGVVRDDDGVPIALRDPYPLAMLGGEGIELTWLDDATVALLWSDGDQRMMREQPVGGEGSEVRAPEGAAHIAGGNQSGSVRLLTEDGGLFVQRGSWQLLATDVSVLAVQQGTPG
ncbi:LpqB family beta-propeller domain-containing protein [Microbacterium sp.]|uniref:LpqB family beta-propeller domain-containing protein n=1 Tax=Microbacterium sp. TaxID=51671 RepID=UPI003734ED38